MQKQIANNIKHLRNCKTLKAAKHIGVSRQHYWCIEAGSSGIDAVKLRQLCELFGCSADEILGLDDN